jgi:UDP-glucose 4-epimerase
MKVGVTGGAGFIGGWVVDELINRGFEPVVFDHRGRAVRDVEFMLGDIRDQTAVYALAQRVDRIIHLATMLGTQETMEHPRSAIEVNVLGGLNVLEACRFAKVPAVNICVGNHWMRNTYSTSKTTVERLVEQYNANLGTFVNNVRVVNAYGPGQGAAPPFSSGKVRKIMPAFICRALSGMPIEVYGDGSQTSDCVWVGDVARILVHALHFAAAGRTWPTPVEVGPIGHTTVQGVALLVANEVAKITGVEVPIVHLPMRPGEPEGGVVTADTSTLAWVDESPDDLLPLHEGVARTVAWFVENEGKTWRRPHPARVG